MDLYQALKNRQEKLSLVGLGYVGMPIAVAFSKKVDVIGFDVNAEKVQLYQKGIDPTKEVGDEAIKSCTVDFTNDETKPTPSITSVTVARRGFYKRRDKTSRSQVSHCGRSNPGERG